MYDVKHWRIMVLTFILFKDLSREERYSAPLMLIMRVGDL